MCLFSALTFLWSTVKLAVSVCLSVCPSICLYAYNNLKTTDHILVESYIEEFCEKLLSLFIFG